MKNIYAIILAAITSISCFAQGVAYDNVSLGAGNANMVWYSLSNGEVGTAALADWHIALDVRPMGSTARINGGLGVQLFEYGTLDEWDTATLEGWDMTGQNFNDQSDWSNAAFSQGGDGMFDFGWGVYDVITHIVTSDKTYLLQLADESWKKVALLSLESGVYQLQWANLDGTEETTMDIEKADYPGKLFAYCNLEDQTVSDLEPSEPWDFVFLKYLEDVGNGAYYAVAGVLNHPAVTTQEVNGLTDPFQDGNYSFDSFSSATNVIGHDWKTYVPQQGYVLENERCYFVADQDSAFWRVVFTEFEGSATGNIGFGKVLLTGTNSVVESSSKDRFALYPNPAELHSTVNFQLHQQSASNVQVSIYGLDGSLKMRQSISGQATQISLESLSKGMFIVQVLDGNGGLSTEPLIIH